jgi:hypothetical protein
MATANKSAEQALRSVTLPTPLFPPSACAMLFVARVHCTTWLDAWGGILNPTHPTECNRAAGFARRQAGHRSWCLRAAVAGALALLASAPGVPSRRPILGPAAPRCRPTLLGRAGLAARLGRPCPQASRLSRSPKAQHRLHQETAPPSNGRYEFGAADQAQPQCVMRELATTWALPLAVHNTASGTARADIAARSSRTAASSSLSADSAASWPSWPGGFAPCATARSSAARVAAPSSFSRAATSDMEHRGASRALTTSCANEPAASLISESRRYPSTAEEPHLPNT